MDRAAGSLILQHLQRERAIESHEEIKENNNKKGVIEIIKEVITVKVKK